MKLKFENNGEKRVMDIQANSLLQVADRITRRYGYGAIIASDYDRGILILNNGVTITDLEENKRYKEMLKYM